MEEEYDVTPEVTALCSPQVVSSVNNTPAPSAMNIIKNCLIPAPAIAVVTKAPKLGCSIESIIPALVKSNLVLRSDKTSASFITSKRKVLNEV